MNGIIKNQNKKNISVILSLFSSVGFILLFSLSTANIIPIMLSFVFYIIYMKAFSIEYNKRIDIVSSIIACFFSLSMIPSHLDSLDKTRGVYLLNLLICFISFSLLIKALLIILYNKTQSISIEQVCEESEKEKVFLKFLLVTILFMIAWLPFFLFVYPAELSQDSVNQFMQAFGYYPLSDHHPVIHTLLIKRVIMLGMMLFNDNLTYSLAFYSFCQALFLSMSFSYLIVSLLKNGIKKWIIIASILFYIIPAYNGFHSVVMWKDIWFVGFVTIFSVALWQMIRRIKTNCFKICHYETFLFIISSIGICLFRSNGLYAYILFLVFFIVYSVKNNQRMLIAIGLIAVIVSLIIKVPVYNTMGVERPDILESLAIPLQQVSAVIVEEKEIKPEERQLIENVIDISIIPSTYESTNCDPIKFAIRDKGGQNYISEHKGEFFRLWMNLGLRYPATYIRAYIKQTYGYYDPNVQDWVYYSISGTQENPFRVKILPEKYYSFIAAYSQLYLSIPFLGLFWSIGAVVWLTAFLIGQIFIKKNRTMLLVILPNIGIWLTLLVATPVYAEFRYIYSLFTVMPLYLVCALGNYDLVKSQPLSRERIKK